MVLFLRGLSEDVTYFLKKDISAHLFGRRISPSVCLLFKNSNNFFNYLYFLAKLVFKLFASPDLLIQTNDNNLKPTYSCQTK